MDFENMFKVHNEIINANLQISVFEVETMNSELQQCLDNSLISICEGQYSSSDLKIVKKRISNLFESKDDNWKMGAIAEFFVHLYMNLTGYTQHCIFLNLEENSIKKGFDGYYNLNSKQWVMESKSGSVLSKNISHNIKIKEAIKDLKEKFEGNSKNNPWQNAYNHACHCDVGVSSDIKKIIKKLSDEYTSEIFHNLQDFNIVPCATLFLNTVWKPENKKIIVDNVKKAIETREYKCAHIICITQANINIFNEYINN